MDSAHTRPPPLCSTSTIPHAACNSRFSTSPTTPAFAKRYSEPTPSRQRRLLQNRNARFPTKKLSLSNLGSRFSQLIHANDEIQSASEPVRGQENTTVESYGSEYSKRRRSSTNSLGILDEISNSNCNRRSKQIGNIIVYEDTSERPLLEHSPFSSPAAYQEVFSQDCSPVGFNHVHDIIGTMRLREISGNELRGPPLASSPYSGSIKSAKKRKSIQTNAGFDSQEYIEHIEKELAAVRSEMLSPTTNKPLKDQLKIARSENEKLRQDMVDMREIYEAEVKRNIEHRAEMEVELKRKVRDLEEELEQKLCTIRDLELLHDEKRLDNNTIDTLKATIEKLEHNKLSLEDENRSVSKRNEVLSELLAMSPTKMQSFELRSPVREKRSVRPMSMILPRQPTSPNGRQLSQPASTAASPSTSACGPFFSPVRSRGGSPRSTSYGLGLSGHETLDSIGRNSGHLEQGYFDCHRSTRSESRRSTLQSHISTNDAASILSSSSPAIDQVSQRLPPKRKPRKFMSGSTQLRPLLLPAIAGDSVSISASSAASSPKVDTRREFSEESIDPTTYFLSQPEEMADEDGSVSLGSPGGEITEIYAEGRIPEYQTMEDIIAEQGQSSISSCMSSLDLNFKPQSRSCITAEVAHRVNDETDHCVVPITMGSGVPFSDTSYGLGEDKGSFNALCMESLPLQRIGPDPRSIGFDLNALNQLGFPDPDYDAMPDELDDADSTLLIDRPQPLFSFAACPDRQSREVTIPTHTEQSHLGLSGSIEHITNPHEIGQTSACSQGSPVVKRCISQHLSGNIGVPHTRSTVIALENRAHDRAILPQHLSPGMINRLSRPRSPIDLLRAGKLGARPLASLTIRTIFGTISNCTTQVRDFRRDPLALARRVLANVWVSNWSRFGKLSWWVLGLFFSTRLGRQRTEQWDWEEYDGEEIARKACSETNESASHAMTRRQSSTASPANLEGHERYECHSSASQSKSGWGRSLLLWGKFSIAIMLAVGGAVVRGPGEMLKEVDGHEDGNLEECHCLGSLNRRNHNCCQSSQSNPHTQTRDPRHRASTRQNDLHLTSACLTDDNDLVRDQRMQQIESLACCTKDMDQRRRQSFEKSEEETVRAVKSPRKNVAEYFQQDGMSHIRNSHRNNRHSEFSSRPLHYNSGSINGGTVHWPPSPGPIYPEDDYTLHERRF